MRRLARAAVALLALTLPPAATAETILAPGEPLTRDAVATLVHAGLVDRGVAPEVVVEVDTPGPAVPNRALTPMRVALADLRYDPDSGHYTARLRATLATGESTLIDSNGKVHELVPVVRLRRPLSRGQTIAAEDVQLERLPARAAYDDALRRVEDVVGMQAIRALATGRPIRARDVEAPWLVARDEPVAMVFRRAGLEIVGAGVALDPGRRGPSVRVRNDTSGEVRRAIVMAARRVAVEPGGALP